MLFTNIVFMEVYESLRQYLLNGFGLEGPSSTLLSSFTARFLVTSANLPFESARIKLSNEVSASKPINFHGYKITLCRDMIYSALFWSALEGYRNHAVGGEYRNKLTKDQGFSWKNFTVNLLPGFFIGAGVSALTTPLDTLKTRVQSQGTKNYNIMEGILDIYSK